MEDTRPQIYGLERGRSPSPSLYRRRSVGDGDTTFHWNSDREATRARHRRDNGRASPDYELDESRWKRESRRERERDRIRLEKELELERLVSSRRWSIFHEENERRR